MVSGDLVKYVRKISPENMGLRLVNGLMMQRNDFPFALPAQAADTVNGKGYVITCSGSLYQYTPATDTLEYLTSCCVNIETFASGPNIFVVNGGAKDFWKYSPSQDQWTQEKIFPERALKRSFVCVVDKPMSD